MQYRYKKIGIWGFGITGKAAVTFFAQQSSQLSVLDCKQLNVAEKALLLQHNVRIYQPEQVNEFLAEQDYIFASPGIDIRPYYHNYSNKWIFELDLFAAHWHKPIIAITGTVGKTTITSFLFQIMSALNEPHTWPLNHGFRGTNKSIIMGGNIGIASLDLIQQQDMVDLCVLETADVQLRYAQSFAPDLAIWTNFSPNHLDWHDSLASYFKAKCRILAHQKQHHIALIPLELESDITTTVHVQSIIHFFTLKKPDDSVINTLHKNQFLFCMHNEFICVYQDRKWLSLIDCKLLPNTTYDHNWLIIIAALHILQIPMDLAIPLLPLVQPAAYRLEKVATVAGVDFYNDAKSTAPAATLAAVKKLSTHPIILFLGGLSKNVDRTMLIEQLTQYKTLKAIYCFGAEASALAQLCSEQSLPATAHNTLEDAFKMAIGSAHYGDQILFSPAGSSFDLFNNYEERGKRFTSLVQQYQTTLHIG